MIMTTWNETALLALAAKAQTALPPAVNGRIDKACRLVRSASVELHADGTATVLSETDGLTGYLVQDGRCTCPDFHYQAPEGWCAHHIAVRMVQRLSRMPQDVPSAPDVTGETLDDADAPTGTPAASHAGSHGKVPAEYVVVIQNKPFVKFAGLLQMAHAQGLVALRESWTYNDADLSLAQASARFRDGRCFAGAGDATPSNVTKKVTPHFRRVALTRAKSRALRDALNIDMVAVEELGDSE
jgi:hypothetical protein